MNKEYKPRNLSTVANKLIKVIKDNCDWKNKQDIIEEINEVIYDSSFKAPELMYICWNNLADILNANFNPDNSDWEKEICDIFSGKATNTGLGYSIDPKILYNFCNEYDCFDINNKDAFEKLLDKCTDMSIMGIAEYIHKYNPEIKASLIFLLIHRYIATDGLKNL